jgi:hypothetical protein
MNSGIKRFAAAASRAEIVNNGRAGMRSARFNSAEPKAPTTNPICTDIVNQARAESVNCHAAVNAGTTAEAENQTPFAKSTDSARRSSVRHLVRSEPLRTFSVAVPLSLQNYASIIL